MAPAPPADGAVGVGHEGVEAVLVALGVARRQDRVAGGRGREVGGVAHDDLDDGRRPTHRLSGCSWSKASVASAPSTSNYRRFLRPGETWLTTTDPARRRPVRNSTTAMSSVVTARRRAAAPRPGASNAWLVPARASAPGPQSRSRRTPRRGGRR